MIYTCRNWAISQQGYGMATFPEKSITPETLFYTASTTRSFTAVAVFLLIDDFANSSERLFWQLPLAKVMRGILY